MFERILIKLVPCTLAVAAVVLLFASPSTSAQSPESPGLWIPPVVNLSLLKGTPGTKRMLSVASDGSFADLYGTDDRSGRQRWIFQRSPDGRSYNIIVGGGTPGDRKYLSASPDGTKVGLAARDDGSGRQRWSTEAVSFGASNIPQYLYRIRVAGGMATNRIFLSSTPDGNVVDLHSQDDGSGRQNWAMNAPSGSRFNIAIAGGISNGQIVLGKGTRDSRGLNDNKTALYTSDDRMPERSWGFAKRGFTESYSIWTNVGDTSLFLTGSGTAPVRGTSLEFYEDVKESPKGMMQSWVLEDIGSGLVRFRRTYGVQMYLSATADGSKVDTFNRDDGSGRQRWRITYSMDR